MSASRDRAEPSPIYEVRVKGHLGPRLLAAFPALQAERDGSETLLKGPLEDQAALHGVLVQIERLGIELLGVRRLTGSPEKPPGAAEASP